MNPLTPADQDAGPGGTEQAIDLDGLAERMAGLRARYRSASPFPHIALDGFLSEEVGRAAEAEIPPAHTTTGSTTSIPMSGSSPTPIPPPGGRRSRRSGVS